MEQSSCDEAELTQQVSKFLIFCGTRRLLPRMTLTCPISLLSDQEMNKLNLLPCSLEPATGFYPEPDESSLYLSLVL
jgi:hypothetical protein